MDNRLSIYVSSPDSYADVFAIFLKGFRKFWSDCTYEFILTTNTRSYEGITCICNNKQNDTWVERTLVTLPAIKSKYILLMCDDIIISDKVDNSVIERLLDYMDSHEIKYCRLEPIPKGDIIKSFPLLRSVNRQTPYAINLQLGIFRKDFFVELIGDGSLSSWDIENSINEQAAFAPNEDFKDVVAVSKYILPYIHGVYKGKWIRQAIANLTKLGLYEDSGRGIVSFSQQLKIDMTHWFQWKISLNQRRMLKSVLSMMGIRFATKW